MTEDSGADIIARAQLLLAAGEPSAASHVLDRHLRAHPDDARAMIELAHVLVVQGDPGAAERITRDALADHDAAPWARAMLSQIIALDPTRAEESLQWSRAAVAALPTAPGLHVVLAARLGRLGRTEDALREIATATLLAPDDLSVRVALHVQSARALLPAPGAAAEAAAHARAALQLDPSDDTAAGLLAAAQAVASRPVTTLEGPHRPGGTA
ncbi:tetratricopeptide repeat protein [Microbacterium gorillae]|uniref:tetratricopeptide repeat protein n=1 Tax=Microbacterium gorillae TaxID=1231063 RepID=UPI000A40617A|nr:tetratricopeptide repeat protein [Microbacterium gorillae]